MKCVCVCMPLQCTDNALIIDSNTRFKIWAHKEFYEKARDRVNEEARGMSRWIDASLSACFRWSVLVNENP